MSSSILSVPSDIKFDEAIALTQTFITKLKNNDITVEKIIDFVSQLVQTSNGARGFFVTYLTASDRICVGVASPVENPPHPGIIIALKTHPEIAADLLVKNLAMSTAQQLYHQRRNDREMVASSGMVAARTTKIIQELNLPQIREMCQELLTTCQTGSGDYSEFLVRWGYDEEQKKAIERVLTTLLS